MEKNQVKQSIIVFGWNISSLQTSKQLAILAGGALVSSLGFAYLQEVVTTLPGFSHYDLMTFLTTLTFCLCGFLERILTNDMKRKAQMSDYFLLSMFTLGGMYFTNFSLYYLNYTTRIVFKSSKVIPVMLMGVVMQGKKYSSMEYLSVFILVAGIVFFTLGDARESPSYNPLGIVLICFGVVMDAVTANYEEKHFFHAKNCSPAEVMCFASLFGALFSFLGLIVKHSNFFSTVDDPIEQGTSLLEYVVENPKVVVYTVCSSTLGYSSSLFILLLIKVFGATNAEIVKSLRKILSVAISFMAFAKPFTLMHFVGTVLFVVSTAIGVHITQTKAAQRKKAVQDDAEKPLNP